MGKSKGNKGKRVRYIPQLRSFALMLQFYSMKAYQFVRETFNYALSHPTQIRRWYSRIQVDPGFTEAAFKALKVKASQQSQLICALMMDEMAIKKAVMWDGNIYRGYIEMGSDETDMDHSTPLAKDALVFMVVGINSFWKIPIA